MNIENINVWPEEVKLFDCGHGLLEVYQNGDDEANVKLYIRSDIAKDREKEIITYLFNHYGKPIIYSTPKGVDVYGEMGLEKLK